MPWDPNRYLRFADHRTRPGIELLSRIPDIDACYIVDLGCGTGHLTALLQERWPDAVVIGIDSSDEMIERARDDHPDMTWVVDDVAAWEPAEPVDLVFSNAALHWLDDHEHLFQRLHSLVAPDGVLAVQMPDNWDAPTHRIPADVLDSGDWPTSARAALMSDRLSRPEDYARWVQPANVDLWSTTYYSTVDRRRSGLGVGNGVGVAPGSRGPGPNGSRSLRSGLSGTLSDGVSARSERHHGAPVQPPVHGRPGTRCGEVNPRCQDQPTRTGTARTTTHPVGSAWTGPTTRHTHSLIWAVASSAAELHQDSGTASRISCCRQ